jgi:hypothetical protein
MNTIKNFITIIPLQPEKSLTKSVYQARGNKTLDVGIETRFPIVNAIAGYAKGGQKIRVTYVLTDYANARSNYENYFEPELNVLRETMGLEIEEREILTKYDQGVDAKLNLFLSLISSLGDNEELYACTTYGTKPTSQVIPMALNYAYRTKKNVQVGCVVYGEKDHNTGEMHIYDQTALFYMDAIVNKLAENKARDPEKAIRLMLGLDETGEF